MRKEKKGKCVDVNKERRQEGREGGNRKRMWSEGEMPTQQQCGCHLPHTLLPIYRANRHYVCVGSHILNYVHTYIGMYIYIHGHGEVCHKESVMFRHTYTYVGPNMMGIL